MRQRCSEAYRRWDAQARLLEASSHQRILERGYVIVRTNPGLLVRRARELVTGQTVTLQFRDSPPDAYTPARIVESRPGFDPHPQGIPRS